MLSVKWLWADWLVMSALPSGHCSTCRDVRFVPKADISRLPTGRSSGSVVTLHGSNPTPHVRCGSYADIGTHSPFRQSQIPAVIGSREGWRGLEPGKRDWRLARTFR